MSFLFYFILLFGSRLIAGVIYYFLLLLLSFVFVFVQGHLIMVGE